jgi:heat shock protein HslJ
MMLLAGLGACNYGKNKKGATTAATAESVSTKTLSEAYTAATGTYFGVVPCADCEGIETTVILKADGTFDLTQVYQGKSNLFNTHGEVSEKNGNLVLTDAVNKNLLQLKIGEGILTQLDMEGNVIEGEHAANYILTKAPEQLTAKVWKLAELNGKPVESTAFLLFDPVLHRISGNLGCNNFSGSYFLSPGSRIHIAKVVATQKMCQKNMEVEDELKKILSTVDNFAFGDDKSLILNRARMAPLAKFILAE